MEESIDVKALRARFNNKASASDTSSSRDSSSPKSPRPGFGKAIIPVTESDMAHHRLSPSFPPPFTGPGLSRFPEPLTSSVPSRPPFFPQPPPYPGIRASVQLTDSNKVKQTGEMLQNIVLRNQRPSGTKLAQIPAQAPALTPTFTSLPRQKQHRQRSTGEVTPLRRPLPPEVRLPLKPKRPPNVNLEPFRRINRGPALPSLRKVDNSPTSSGRKMSLPTVVSPPILPQRSNKPSQLPRQVASVDIADNQETYDDIGSFERNESCSDTDLQCVNEDDDVYQFIDEDQVEVNQVDVNVEKMNKKELIKHREQNKKEKLEQQKKEKLLKKNFLLQGDVEVLHTAKVRHDWQGGGKLDLSVQQGESVDIIRVKNNPGGKWLARSLHGDYGYISNTCVDIDYEEVKRKLLQSKKIDTSPLPPPPPDPPQMFNMDSNYRDSMIQEDDDYDDVQIVEDFPPPPPNISIDPKMEKELRKKFKYEGPFKVLHTMMVDPNGIIKKLGSKDLLVSPGEVLDIIQFANSKKALCCNRFGKYGYVARSLLLPMEGDVYDDVDYPSDVYDNDSPHTDF
ncbi:FYN-binding protein 1 [Solea solea]|uniref:FYN-binding protein 1 n=1 Tax=Solea solea TaxID=90069 RepID=UPI00272B17CE|nr:FYN-binding protein 1 [Solea solea]